MQAQFSAALSDGFIFDGEFAVSAHYAMGVAPNPCLELDGLGTVGLPLSDREARTIVSACESVHNPDSGAGIWEMPADKVRVRHNYLNVDEIADDRFISTIQLGIIGSRTPLDLPQHSRSLRPRLQALHFH